ncbi:hypothetical protein WG68_14295 [Arsukibacterium ikkense]|uniref:Uncharacterized protein n=1 Tax=Arsukibacterium ikkense TaxID=336831 RepID=A0A0M2V1J4_9GAMM|nr:hypothetical protein [Arsukibacterium ikkense]KKO44712.1 hypothetical protein WG68_14295 [Arsukibacterium ikkense]
MKKIALLNNASTIASFNMLDSELLDEAGTKEVRYYCNADLVVIYEITRGKIRNTEYQTELPLAAAAWIKDRILNGFWKLPSEGGLPKDQHQCIVTFDSEEIIIGRSMNAGRHGKPGFKIVNKSRKSHILASWPQEFQITDERVEKVLLPLFDQLGVS